MRTSKGGDDVAAEKIWGDTLRKARKRLGLKQEDLAQVLGVRRQTVGAWEKGTTSPDIAVLSRVAATLKTSVSYLVGETEDPRPPSETGPFGKAPFRSETETGGMALAGETHTGREADRAEGVGNLTIELALPSGRTVAASPKQVEAYRDWERDRDAGKTLTVAATLGIPLSDMVPRETSEGYPTERHRNLAAIVKLATAGHCRDALPERDAEILRRIAEEDICHILAIVRETLRWKLDQISRNKKGDR